MQELPLSELVGDDGLVRLLQMMDERKFRAPGEVIQMVMRLHTPGFEEIRDCIGAVITRDETGIQLPGFYSQAEIEAARSLQSEQRKLAA